LDGMFNVVSAARTNDIEDRLTYYALVDELPFALISSIRYATVL
jgi:hypothetical protein